MKMANTLWSGATTYAVLAAAGLGLAVAPVQAYDEIQVYGWDINDPGQFGLEMHSNYVIDGRDAPSYRGELPPDGILAFTPEFSYGVVKHFEVGLYLPLSVDVQRNLSFFDDAKLRAKWLNADDPEFFYGLNVEVGRVPRRYSEQKWGAEIRPIIGGMIGRWFLAANPNLELNLSGSSQKPDFNPSVKITRQIAENVSVGFEHYSDLGSPNHLGRSSQQGHTTYLVTDISIGNLDLNVGIGRGWTHNDDDWTVKVILGGIPFVDMLKRVAY